MSLEHVEVVRGKSIVSLPVTQLLARAGAAARVVVDVGAGDGRLAYRLARAHPDWLCVAVDACAAGMRALSWRAERKPSRGGAPNAVFVRASVECLPQAFAGIADEVLVYYPWGSLLRAVVEPDLAVLRLIVQVGRPGAALRIRVNETALLALLGGADGRFACLEPRLERDYRAAGVGLNFIGPLQTDGKTTWGARLRAGQRWEVFAIEGTCGLG